MKILSIAAASLLAAISYNDNVVVNSFQISPSLTAAVSTTLRRTPLTTTILYSSNNNDESLTTKELELNELSNQLEQAKERFNKSLTNVEVLQKEKEDVVSTTDSIINKLKSGYVDEITDLGDQIEGAQDNLRTTTSTTKSSISSIQSDAIQREIQLKNELSDLEDRLAALRKDADLVAKERDMLTKSINTESRIIRKQSNQDLNAIKAELMKDKKAISRTERYELGARLQTAQLQKDPSAAALQEEKSISPTIPSLKDMLTSLASKFRPDIDDLKEQRNANQMFFDTSFKQLRLDKKEELKIAKGVYETEVNDEDTSLEDAVSSYEQQLVDSEKELQRSIDQLNEPIESFGTDAINQELLNQQAIQQESDAAITQQQLDSEAALQDSAESILAIQDSYDAKLEDAKRNLIKTKYRTSNQLKQADKKKRSHRIQLIYEREELTRSLSQLMNDERVSAKAERQALKKDKSDTLASNLQQVSSTNAEIATTRSKLIYIQQEVNMLENTSKRNHLKIDKLTEERGSFRKQLKRTVKVAVNKLPLVSVE